MNENYLWDKTGSDAEIESLENALAAFRSEKSAPPVLPAKIVPFKKASPPRRSFRLAYAIAACAAFVMIGWGIWYQLSGYEMKIQENLVITIQPNLDPRKEIPVAKETGDSPETKIETPKQIPARKSVRASKIVQTSVSQKPEKIKKIETKSTEVRLTEEEKYAYDQLMLALSITSSKLKMVKDKVQNLDEETAILEKGR